MEDFKKEDRPKRPTHREMIQVCQQILDRLKCLQEDRKDDGYLLADAVSSVTMVQRRIKADAYDVSEKYGS